MPTSKHLPTPTRSSPHNQYFSYRQKTACHEQSRDATNCHRRHLAIQKSPLNDILPGSPRSARPRRPDSENRDIRRQQQSMRNPFPDHTASRQFSRFQNRWRLTGHCCAAVIGTQGRLRAHRAEAPGIDSSNQVTSSPLMLQSKVFVKIFAWVLR